MYCDLHTHSIYSDGTLSPGEIIAAAGELGLTVALTDHNTVAGLEEFMAEARRLGVQAVAGTELSTEHEGAELHVLGLFLPRAHWADIEDMTREFHRRKEQSNRDMVHRLNAAGYAIDYDRVAARNPGGNANRAHIAAELMERGYVASIKEAFDTLLYRGGRFYVPFLRPSTEETIRLLGQLGAVPVLAHPLQELSGHQLRRALPGFIAAGLMGMEVMHSSFAPEKAALAAEIAGASGLLPSGGSDFHGDNKPDVALGRGKGDMAVPIRFYEQLRAVSRT